MPSVNCRRTDRYGSPIVSRRIDPVPTTLVELASIEPAIVSQEERSSNASSGRPAHFRSSRLLAATNSGSFPRILGFARQRSGDPSGVGSSVAVSSSSVVVGSSVVLVSSSTVLRRSVAVRVVGSAVLVRVVAEVVFDFPSASSFRQPASATTPSPPMQTNARRESNNSPCINILINFQYVGLYYTREKGSSVLKGEGPDSWRGCRFDRYMCADSDLSHEHLVSTSLKRESPSV